MGRIVGILGGGQIQPGMRTSKTETAGLEFVTLEIATAKSMREYDRIGVELPSSERRETES